MKRIWLITTFIALAVSIIIHFNETSFVKFVIFSIVFSIFIFLILFLLIKCIQYALQKKILWTILTGAVLIFLILLTIGVKITSIVWLGVCPAAVQEKHFRTNIFTGQCDYGGFAHCLKGDPWYYKSGCNISVEKQIDILKSEGVYKEIVERCKQLCDDIEQHCQSRLPGKSISCERLVDCSSPKCD